MNEDLRHLLITLGVSAVTVGVGGACIVGYYEVKRYIEEYKIKNPGATTVEAIIHKINEIYEKGVDRQYEISRRYIV